jgi:hypothetical protein
MKTIKIEVKGHYSKNTATILAKVSESGKRATISARQLKAAADKTCYAGADYLDLPQDQVNGPVCEIQQDGSVICNL